MKNKCIWRLIKPSKNETLAVFKEHIHLVFRIGRGKCTIRSLQAKRIMARYKNKKK
jgi:hypothetical protein